jgi:hypothetical protein
MCPVIDYLDLREIQTNPREMQGIEETKKM